MKQNKAKPTLSLSTKSRFARNTGSPLTKDGCAPTLTATYEFGRYGISSCCNDIQKEAGGIKWKYAK